MKIKMALKKVCKGSVRYDAIDASAPLKNVYVSKTVLPTTPLKSITVEIAL